MQQRGKKSEAALSVAPVVGLRRLPEPPACLTERQAEVWRLVIASRGGDMIPPEAYPVLVEYCRAVVAADDIAAELDHFNPEWSREADGLSRWDKLLAMQDRKSARVASLATKLRLTPQSRYFPDTAAAKSKRGEKRKPWESE